MFVFFFNNLVQIVFKKQRQMEGANFNDLDM